MKGLFITFEGPDGSGKTTQINKVFHYLHERGYPVVQTREPGGTRISDQIRSILLNPEYNELTHETEILLYAASRAQHVREKIKPSLDEGKIVLCDRFVDASVAYQGYGLGISTQDVIQVNQFAIKDLTPDRTYFIDLSPEDARQRLLARDTDNQGEKGLDRIEQKEFAYHARVREGFYRIYEENKHRVLKIDGSNPIDFVYERIIGDLEALLAGFK